MDACRTLPIGFHTELDCLEFRSGPDLVADSRSYAEFDYLRRRAPLAGLPAAIASRDAALMPYRQSRQLACALRLLATHHSDKRFNVLCRRPASCLQT
jgi:hypothetical protein